MLNKKIISYAQNFEDVMLWRAFKNIKNGIYIDVGANDPLHDNTTKIFYDNNWSGINIEPIDEHFKELEKDRVRDINLNCLVGEKKREEVEFFVSNIRGLSTTKIKKSNSLFHKNIKYKKVYRKMLSLNDILISTQFKEIHFLKIDTEGSEEEVLKGLDLSIYRPWIIIVESNDFQDIAGESDRCELLLKDASYSFVYYDGLNKFYLANEQDKYKKYFYAPPNIHDNFDKYLELKNIENVEIHNKNHEIKLLNEGTKTLSRKVIGLSNTISEQQNQIDSQKNQIISLRVVEQNYDAIIASGFWKYTAFIRKILKKKIFFFKFKIILVKFLSILYNSINKYPKFKGLIRKIIRIDSYPGLKLKIKKLIFSQSFNHSTLTKKSIYSNPVEYKNNYEVREYSYTYENYIRSIETPSYKPKSFPIISKRSSNQYAKLNTKYFILVDETIKLKINTGVQRLVRELSLSLTKRLEDIIFIKWNKELDFFTLINEEDYKSLINYYKIDSQLIIPSIYKKKLSYSEVKVLLRNQNLIVPEVPYMHHKDQSLSIKVIEVAKKYNMFSTFVFYDATPLHQKVLKGISTMHAFYMKALLLSDNVVSISDTAKNDLNNYWEKIEKSPRKFNPTITTIHLGVKAKIREYDNYNNLNNKIILSVGTIEKWKNQRLLIEAFKQYLENNINSEWKLYLVGNISTEEQVYLNAYLNELQDNIQYLGRVDEDELDKLYKECTFTVFPSTMEGFGLPIIESLSYGKPCICANFGSMSEIASDKVTYQVDTTNIDVLKDSIESLIDDDQLFSSYYNAIQTYKLKSWDNYTDELLENIKIQNDKNNSIKEIFYCVTDTSTYEKNTGIQRVVRQLGKELLNNQIKLVPIKWSSKNKDFIPISNNEKKHLSKWNGPNIANWGNGTLNEVDADSQKWILIPEVMNYFSNEEWKYFFEKIKQYNFKSACIFYDAIPWKLNKFYDDEISKMHANYMQNISLFDKIYCISNTVRNDLLNFLYSFNIRTPDILNRVITIELAADFEGRPRSIKNFGKNKDQIFKILCVGTVEPRKNHINLIEAIKIVNNNTKLDFELIIIGNNNFKDLEYRIENEIKSLKNISWIKNVNDQVLVELYKDSYFTVYPSIEEGFGIPIIESLWYGKPCICHNSSASYEVSLGGGCIAIDANKPDEIAGAIINLLEGKNLYDSKLTELDSRKFKSWKIYASEMIADLNNQPYLD